MPSQCRNAALRFLKIRPRSIHELRQKLEAKKFGPLDINEAIEYLVSVHLLDDRAFTASWIQYRLARPFGFRRITTELKEKGVPASIMEEALAAAKAQYDEGDAALELARRRAERLSGIDPLKKRKRVGGFLLRRGYSMEAVMKVLKKIN